MSPQRRPESGARAGAGEPRRDAPGASPAPAKGPRDELKSWIKSLAVAVAAWIVISSFLIQAYRIPSPSMENTLLVGDFLFVNKAIFGGRLEVPFTGLRFPLRLPAFAEPHDGELIIFRSVEDSTPNLVIVKRVIGQPGDTLRMVHDTIYRNGRRLDEPYALYLAGGTDVLPDYRLEQMRRAQLPHYVGPDPAHYRPDDHTWGPVVVPPDSFWVMGDNRDESYDSRYWGFLPRSHIEGRPALIYFSIGWDPIRIRWNRFFRHPS